MVWSAASNRYAWSAHLGWPAGEQDQRLGDAGVEVELQVEPGMYHGADA